MAGWVEERVSKELWSARRAVIEAAEEVERLLPTLEGKPVPYPLGKKLSWLGKAVRALTESEEG